MLIWFISRHPSSHKQRCALCTRVCSLAYACWQQQSKLWLLGRGSRSACPSPRSSYPHSPASSWNYHWFVWEFRTFLSSLCVGGQFTAIIARFMRCWFHGEPVSQPTVFWMWLISVWKAGDPWPTRDLLPASLSSCAEISRRRSWAAVISALRIWDAAFLSLSTWCSRQDLSFIFLIGDFVALSDVATSKGLTHVSYDVYLVYEPYHNISFWLTSLSSAYCLWVWDEISGILTIVFSLRVPLLVLMRWLFAGLLTRVSNFFSKWFWW